MGERRRGQRIRLVKKVGFNSQRHGYREARVINVSHGGLMLEAECNVRPFDIIHLHGLYGERDLLSVSIHWCRRAGEQFRMGGKVIRYRDKGGRGC